jgi:hypothetical protein
MVHNCATKVDQGSAIGYVERSRYIRQRGAHMVADRFTKL